MGLGLGTFPHEFEAAGYKKTTLQDRANMAKDQRPALPPLLGRRKDQLQRRLLRFQRRGAQTDAEETDSDLVRRRHAGFLPPRGGLLRRLDAGAHSHGDVQQNGQVPRRAVQASGRPMVTTGAIPITSIDKNRDVALSKVNVKGLINEGNTPAQKDLGETGVRHLLDGRGHRRAAHGRNPGGHRPRYQTLRRSRSQSYRLRSALPLRRLVPADRLVGTRSFAGGARVI